MKEFLVDTNCVLRYLLKDIPSQSQQIRDYFVMAKEEKIKLFIPLLVFIELDFALINLYQFTKNEVVQRLVSLLNFPFLTIEKRDILLKSLILYNQVSLELVDIVLFFEAKLSGRELLTFDKKLKKLKSS